MATITPFPSKSSYVPPNSVPNQRNKAANTDRVASVRQLDLIARLRNEKEHNLGPNPVNLSMGMASRAIQYLLGCPNKKIKPAELAVPGFYIFPATDDARIFKIQQSPVSGGIYGKVLDREGSAAAGKPLWSYHTGARTLVGSALQDGTARRMNEAEAAELGQLYGACLICGRTLTNEESIERGIGPICAGKL